MRSAESNARGASLVFVRMTITDAVQERDATRIDTLSMLVPLPNEKLARFIGSDHPLVSDGRDPSESLCHAEQLIAGTDFP